MQTALIALGVFYALGWVVGEVARRIVEENVRTELVQRLGTANGTGTPS